MQHVAHNDDQRVDAGAPVGLSEAGTAALLRALVESRGKRIASSVVDGHRVWIKRYDAASRGLAKWLHAAASALAFHPFLRSSPWLSPAAQAQRELRKSRAFRDAGFPTPAVHYAREALLVSAHCEPLASHRLKQLAGDPAAHDALLIRCAEALGRAHAAGLCHGRPHPRDMFLEQDGIGFLDFEEEPEAAMPLPVAQARDAWLLMQQVAGVNRTPCADKVAFEAWRRHAPATAVAELRSAMRLFSPVTTLLRFGGKLVPLGGDARRMLNAGLLLRDILTQTSPAPNPPNGKSAHD